MHTLGRLFRFTVSVGIVLFFLLRWINLSGKRCNVEVAGVENADAEQDLQERLDNGPFHNSDTEHQIQAANLKHSLNEVELARKNKDYFSTTERDSNAIEPESSGKIAPSSTGKRAENYKSTEVSLKSNADFVETNNQPIHQRHKNPFSKYNDDSLSRCLLWHLFDQAALNEHVEAPSSDEMLNSRLVTNDDYLSIGTDVHRIRPLDQVLLEDFVRSEKRQEVDKQSNRIPSRKMERTSREKSLKDNSLKNTSLRDISLKENTQYEGLVQSTVKKNAAKTFDSLIFDFHLANPRHKDSVKRLAATLLADFSLISSAQSLTSREYIVNDCISITWCRIQECYRIACNSRHGSFRSVIRFFRENHFISIRAFEIEGFRFTSADEYKHLFSFLSQNHENAKVLRFARCTFSNGGFEQFGWSELECNADVVFEQCAMSLLVKQLWKLHKAESRLMLFH